MEKPILPPLPVDTKIVQERLLKKEDNGVFCYRLIRVIEVKPGAFSVVVCTKVGNDDWF
jgi:hypothetical protein